jgi:hypothetical protein
MMELTPEIERLIVAAIRAGGYAHVAAEAAGVPRRIFRRWLAAGRYRQFRLSVMQATAHARLTAEWEVRGKDAKTWLHNGPGKEPDGAPGWGKSPSEAPTNDPAAMWRLFGLLDTALTPYPDARQAAAAAIAAGKKRRPRTRMDDFIQ